MPSTVAAGPPSGREPSRLPRRLSPATIARYRQCPRAVYLLFVERVPRQSEPSPHLVVGNAVHGALERFFGLPLEHRSEQVLHRCLRSVWPEHRKPGSFLTVEEERAYGQQALGLLSEFAGRYDLALVPLSRERWVSMRLPHGAEVYGKVDRVDPAPASGGRGQVDVIDYKTGRFQVDPLDLHDEPAAQVYLLAAAERHGRPVRRVRYLYLDSGDEACWEPEPEDVDQAREALLDVTFQMHTDQEFPAHPGEHCGRCPVAHACPDAGRVELADLHVEDDVVF